MWRRRTYIAIMTTVIGGAVALTRLPTESAVPLPNDATVYSTMTEGAFYLMRAEYLDCNDNDVCGEASECSADSPIDRVCNGDNPGTRDLVFTGTARPLWKPTEGPDSNGCAQFDGTNDVGTATGFDYDEADGTDNVSLQLVMKLDDVAERTSVGLAAGPTTGTFIQTGQIRTISTNDTWQYNGNFESTPHNIDFGTPEASNDIAWHLHETLGLEAGFQAIYDGTVQGTGGGGGLNTSAGAAITTVYLGSNSLGQEIEGCISEAVVTEGRATTEADNYRCLRVAVEYPSLTIAGCP